MSNFFEKAKDDVKNLEKELLGPDYNYVSFIKNPDHCAIFFLRQIYYYF